MLSFGTQNLGSAEPGPLGPPYLLLVVRSADMRPIYWPITQISIDQNHNNLWDNEGH